MPQADQNKTKVLSENLFPVIGIGASAGGLDAFKKLVKAIPRNSGMAYIIVQHLHPEHSSALTEILQGETDIAVQEITDNVKVKPENIYVIPANKILVATDGILQLSPRKPADKMNMPIDIFFSSLAEVHQSHAIGIVLSGTGADGTLGLKHIRSQGGITFAQDPETSAYDAMPLSAINSDIVDFILPPEKMPQQLLELTRTLHVLHTGKELTSFELIEAESFKKVLSLLRAHSGVDFTYYKQTTVRRRMLRRLAILKLEKIIDYLEYLQQNKPEVDLLFQEMLIPVTEFFRDSKAFEYLYEKIFTELIKDKSPANPLRIWVAGCATGEEAYSIAMCLYEFLSDKISTLKVQIFASDISEKSIAKARSGLYLKRELEKISASRLEQFFTKTDSGYQVKKIIRDMCVFAQHNFIKDPPFARIDLLSCRNVLIYMEPFLQKKAFNIFHYALKEKGYLFLGKSETTGAGSELFYATSKTDKFYNKKTISVKFMSVTSRQTEETLKDKDYGIQSNKRVQDDFQKNADEILLANFTPAGVIVNEQLDIVQFRGSTRNYLEPASGKASLNVLKMAREGLSFELRASLLKSKNTKKIIVKENIPIDDGSRFITIQIIPLLNSVDLHFLILFKDADTPVEPVSKSAAVKGNKKEAKDLLIEQLTKDLLQARENMRTVAEEQEAANEELQSANEELLSGSEELQSLNEELETSKEELQSTNEELITVNHELFDRNEQFNQARLYAENIVSTIREPILVLNNDFKIKSANNSFYKTFAVSEEDAIGKVLFDLQNKHWDIPGLREKLSKMHSQYEKFLEWETDYNFPIIGERTICFNAQPINKESGENWILLALNDITDRKKVEKLLKKNADDIKFILESIPQITFTVSADGSFTYFNKFFLNYTGMDLQQAILSGWQSATFHEQLEEVDRTWKHSMKTGYDYEMEIKFKLKSDETYRWHICRALAIKNNDGSVASWVGGATDIHDHKTKEQAKDEFISIASHELKTPLTSVKAYIQMLKLNIEEGSTEGSLLFAQKADIAVNRVNNLIGELLDVSKIKVGKLNLRVEPFNFNEMLLAAKEEVQFGSQRHTIIISGHITPLVSADMQRIQQVVINLLTNAVKYSPNADKVFVNVSQENDTVKVSVTDTGVGINKANLDNVFQLYYREDDRSIHFQGLGIGLSICYEIIERHNGEIWVESELGKGSTFYFTIPVKAR